MLYVENWSKSKRYNVIIVSVLRTIYRENKRFVCMVNEFMFACVRSTGDSE